MPTDKNQAFLRIRTVFRRLDTSGSVSATFKNLSLHVRYASNPSFQGSTLKGKKMLPMGPFSKVRQTQL